MKFSSASEKQTFNFAKNFSKKLAGGVVLGLIGNLGAGKTVFTKGLAAGLGIKNHITSPTFVLMKAYPVKSRPARILPKAKLFNRVNPVKSPNIKSLVHIDAYRVKSARDMIAIGADEYFGRPDTITVIEWADKIKKILPEKTRFVKINISKAIRIIYY